MCSNFLRLLLCLLLIFVISCKKKAFEEYDKSEFYKTQGIIISAEMTKTVLDHHSMKEVKYEYFVNDSLIMEGSEDFSFVDMFRGAPIEVLVHKEKLDVSFYWRNGFSENITAFQLAYIQKKMDTVKQEFENLKK